MTRYRTVLVAATAAALCAPLTAAVTQPGDGAGASRAEWRERFQASRQGPEQTERFSQTYTIGAGGALNVQNIAGDIRLTTTPGREIRVEAVKRVRHRDAAEAKQHLSELRIEVTQVGNRLEVRTVHPRMTGRSFSSTVDYTIAVPPSIAVGVKSISGSLSVDGVRGEVRAETISGDVEMVGTPNLMVAKTVSGNVRARDVGAEASLTLTTISGNVVATAVKVRTLEAESVSGNLQLTGVQVERLTAKSVSGNIDFTGDLARGGRYEFNAHSGGIRLALAEATGFELDASTFSGSIRSDFPVTLRTTRAEPGDRPGQRAGPTSRAIRGTYGDASAILAIRSFSGAVVITRR
jgi:hypothetical protein